MSAVGDNVIGKDKAVLVAGILSNLPLKEALAVEAPASRPSETVE